MSLTGFLFERITGKPGNPLSEFFLNEFSFAEVTSIIADENKIIIKFERKSEGIISTTKK
jgi:hypothetical protein